MLSSSLYVSSLLAAWLGILDGADVRWGERVVERVVGGRLGLVLMV